eukprot:CAMPEP_0114529374 /NCGR_PEP_ID=MMETSP0109-20121206/24799_1 /TAXON_ID=29199 /ORGANISM="Chlorarachnion reptans, Strain CCCM449" /LENGTH=146 /DNA_ID=CAMNT_0001711769 /DNA_START=339 /DNA_END=778 /DNA_ORIENTATION=+
MAVVGLCEFFVHLTHSEVCQVPEVFVPLKLLRGEPGSAAPALGLALELRRGAEDHVLLRRDARPLLFDPAQILGPAPQPLQQPFCDGLADPLPLQPDYPSLAALALQFPPVALQEPSHHIRISLAEILGQTPPQDQGRPGLQLRAE